MIIAQISDTHIARDAPDAERRASDLARTIADINALDPPADVIIYTGDITHGGRPEDYAHAAALLRTARAPVYVAPGNRDDRENLRQAFAGWACLASGSGFLDYAVEDFPVRLIAVDTVTPRSNKGEFAPEHVQRLLDLIDAENTKPIALFMHHPPYRVTVGPDPLNFATEQDMTRLQQVLQHSGRVIGVFCGHVHRSTSGRIGEIQVVVAPCTASSLRKGDYPALMQTRPVYHVHRFEPRYGFSTHVRIVGSADTSAAGAAAGNKMTP
ncbi:MAG: metallophosphoesterase family protein [Steroidobacteraceae bacterium]